MLRDIVTPLLAEFAATLSCHMPPRLHRLILSLRCLATTCCRDVILLLHTYHARTCHDTPRRPLLKHTVSYYAASAYVTIRCHCRHAIRQSLLRYFLTPRFTYATLTSCHDSAIRQPRHHFRHAIHATLVRICFAAGCFDAYTLRQYATLRRRAT